MATIDELLAKGHHRMRLPAWNPHAYLEVPDDGPWAKVFDVGCGVGGGEPIPRLVGECALDTRWEPV